MAQADDAGLMHTWLMIVAAASPSPLPTGPPPGVRNPVTGAIAIGAILIVGMAGLWVYRVIRRGL